MLGIGATTAIFTLVHQVMLKSLPVTKPGELWRIGDKVRCCNWGGYTQGDDGDFALFSWEAYTTFRAHSLEFEDLAALQAGNAPLGVRRGESQAPVDTRNGQYVSGNFFRTLGVQPWIGRLMTDAGAAIGATELLVGVPFPVAALEILRSACGDRTEDAVLTARLFKGPDAVEAGLVHEYMAADGLLERAVAVADELGRISPDSYRMAKEQLRRPAIERIEAGGANDLEVRRIWSSPETAAAIQAQLDSVANRGK